MRPLRFVALGDSLTEGVGDPVGEGWRGWAALLVDGLSDGPDTSVEFTNLAVSGAQTRDVLERQTPAALALGPDVVSVVIGVNDTLRCTFDIHAVAARLDQVYAAFRAQGAVLLTACLPDPGAMLGLPGVLARPLARRQRAVNTVVHALSERHGAVHLHAAEGAWLTDRAMWSADRLHPGSGGTGNSPCASTRCSNRRASPPGPPPRPSPSSLRPPGRPACGGWPPRGRGGWPGGAPTCCRNCSPWPPPRCDTGRAAPAPGSTSAPRTPWRPRWPPCRWRNSRTRHDRSRRWAGVRQRRRTTMKRTGVPGTA